MKVVSKGADLTGLYFVLKKFLSRLSGVQFEASSPPTLLLPLIIITPILSFTRHLKKNLSTVEWSMDIYFMLFSFTVSNPCDPLEICIKCRHTGSHILKTQFSYQNTVKKHYSEERSNVLLSLFLGCSMPFLYMV